MGLGCKENPYSFIVKILLLSHVGGLGDRQCSFTCDNSHHTLFSSSLDSIREVFNWCRHLYPHLEYGDNIVLTYQITVHIE